jgi:hypothetical protein
MGNMSADRCASTPVATPAQPAPDAGRDALPVAPLWRLSTPFVASGAASVLAGGFVAAAGGVAPSPHLSWASAYLVLVSGSAQLLLGGGQALLASCPLRSGLVAWQFAAFNLANAAVLAGTLSGTKGVLDAGGVIFLVALGLFAWATKEPSGRHRSLAFVYRVGLLVLAVSVPIGVFLAR